MKTCCLSCVNIHKKELECDGKRYKTGFKRLEKFNDNDMSQGTIKSIIVSILNVVHPGGQRYPHAKEWVKLQYTLNLIFIINVC